MSQLSSVLAYLQALVSHITLTLPLLSVDTWLIAGRAVFLVFSFVLAAVTFTRWRRDAHRNTEQLATQNAVMLERLAAIEERIASTHYRVGELAGQVQVERRDTCVAEAAVPRYEAAIRLARDGASRDELISSCGLSRQEAELMQRVHAPNPRINLARATA